MADNIAVTPGSGATAAADDVGGILFQRVKLALGADGTAVDAAAGSGAVNANTMRVVNATDDPIISAINATVGYSASASVATRPADTNLYAANDVIGTATGSTAALTFSAIGPASGKIMITGAQLEIDDTALISGEGAYRLHLYNVTPPSALGDNAAWDLPSGDRASYLGYIDLGSIVDLGSTLYVETNGQNKPIPMPASGNLFGYLVTIGTYTPTSARGPYKVTLHAMAL